MQAPADGGKLGRPADPVGELACSRLVVEGTVVKVEPRGESGGSRVTVTVGRAYKPAHAPVRVSFLLDGSQPAPHTGQPVLVRVARDRQNADLWAVGEAPVKAARAWLTEALPDSRHATCPAAGRR
ncbi:hypothetical protein NX794_27370 [Streptomyces sp. LP11]|uniref:Uncharacterized protein n=1 Tax=Streptomyces pyxinicus TaxID=2970331 RepID=A0ABT2B922_9ACTN|nr:hypothetical protein [Streptomyces sp. LP11]MCS0604906.1 hypothetical protein [Streptomyces sp. LP11]